MKGWLVLALVVGAAVMAPDTAATTSSFVDATVASGVDGPLHNSYVHAAAWGDANGDGRPDLFVGTFVTGPTVVPDKLLLNTPGGFVDAGQSQLEVSGRGAGALFADLDGDGDDDLFLSNNRKVNGNTAPVLEPSHLFRNDGGTFVDVTATSGIGVQSSNGRQVGAIDFDGDGLLDLLIVGDAFAGGGPTKLLRNLGGMVFSDATAAAGIPSDVHGLGLAIGDVTGDGWTDVFVAGGPTLALPNVNYLFIANGDGTFRSAPHTLSWMPFTTGPEDWVSSGAFGDVNGDARLDLLVGHHFGSASVSGPGVPVRLYLNRGNDGSGNPIFDDVTQSVGLPPIDSKAPHVDIEDFDNDGRADLFVSVTVGGQPLIFFNTGNVGSDPTFSIPSVADPHYYPVGPVGDFDLDGRLDVFLGEFRSVFQGTPNDVGIVPSRLLANAVSGGNWLDVRVDAPASGVGAEVAVYRAGGAGDPAQRLGFGHIDGGSGFSSGAMPVAHFGLGSETVVDVVVTLPVNRIAVPLLGVAANQRVTVSAPASGNRPPDAVDDAAETLEDTAVIVDVLWNDSDPDGDQLIVASVANGSAGTASLGPGGAVTYTPHADWNGTDSFTYQACDPGGACDSASVTVTVLPVNDPPVAVDDVASTQAGSPVVISVLVNDADVDGDALTVNAASQGTNGTTSFGTSTVTYAPQAGFSGTDMFTYQVCDPSGLCAWASVTVTVTAPAAGPTGWWPLEEASGVTALDASGNGRNGNLVGAVKRVPGVIGRAISLAGSGQRLEVPAVVIHDRSVITVAAWVNTTSTAKQALVGGANPSDANAFDVALRQGAKIDVTPGSGGATRTWSIPAIHDGQWHHLAIVRDAGSGSMTLYRDGVAMGTKDATLAPVDVTVLGFGADQTSAGLFSKRRSWIGMLDEPRSYDRALSAAEIAALAVP